MRRQIGELRLIKRHRKGRDLWTGQRLVGESARHWLRSWVKVRMGEHSEWGKDVEAIASVKRLGKATYVIVFSKVANSHKLKPLVLRKLKGKVELIPMELFNVQNKCLQKSA